MTADITNMNTTTYNCFACSTKQSPCIIHSKTPQSTSPSLRSTASTLELERKLSTSQPTPANGSNTLRCANCFSTTTPLWRRDPQGRTICNACGLYYKLNKVHRPACLKQDVIRRRRRTSKHMKSLTIIPVNLANGVPHPHHHHIPNQMYANRASNANMHYGHYQRHHQGQASHPTNYYQNLGANGRLSQQYTSANQFVQRSSTNLYNNNTRTEATQQQFNQYYHHQNLIPNRSRCNSLPSAAMTNLPVLRSSGTSSTLSSPPQLSNSDSSTFTSPPMENYSTFLNSGHSINSIVNGASELSIGGGSRGVKLPSISELLPEFVDSRAKNF